MTLYCRGNPRRNNVRLGAIDFDPEAENL